MGWKLAKAIHRASLGGQITDRARLALDYMAWTCLDDARPGRRWGRRRVVPPQPVS